MDETFEYRFTRLDPIAGDHIDPPSLAIYETLLNRGPGDLPLPGLATSWQVSADGTSWLLRLREGALFHSGDSCDARAVADALERCRWGDGLARQIWYWDPVDVVTVVDPLTLEFRLHYPCDRLPVLLWGAHTAICNERRRGSAGSEYGVSTADGTGPYRLVSFSPQQVVADRVPTSGRSPVSSGRGPLKIRWHSAPTEQGRRAVLAHRDAHVVRSVSPEWVSEEREGWRYHEQPENGQCYLALASTTLGDSAGSTSGAQSMPSSIGRHSSPPPSADVVTDADPHCLLGTSMRHPTIQPWWRRCPLRKPMQC